MPLRPLSELMSWPKAAGLMWSCSIRWIITAGSMLPARLGMMRPSDGVMPIVVSTERPWSMAHSEAPTPRWQEMISSSPRGRLTISAAFSETKRCEVPWKP